MDAVYVKTQNCLGCRSCEMACAIQHSKGKTLFAAATQSPPPRKRLYVEQAGAVKMPVICRHCEDAPCLNSCISGCLYRDEHGFIRRKKELCIGCWSCVMACPFGVVTRDEILHIAVKCDRCHKLAVPACVNACPTGALTLTDIDALVREKRQHVVAREAAGG